jgi:hypothetical protein
MVGPCADTKKAHQVTLRQTSIFASGAICGSLSAFCDVRGVKRRHSTIHARVGQCGFHKRRQWTCYAKDVFFHMVGSACHVVRSGAFKAQNVNALFFMFSW